MIAVFSRLKANQKEYVFEPETDSEARIVLTSDEQEHEHHFGLRCVFSAYQTRKDPHNWVGQFNSADSANKLKEAQWSIIFTQSRLIVWSPLAVNIMWKMKAKTGAASGGHIKYSWIDQMTLGRTSSGSLGITFLFDTDPKNSINLHQQAELDFWNADEAAMITSELADRIAEYWHSEGAETLELTAELEKLRNHDWNKPDEQLSLFKAGAKVLYLPDRSTIQQAYNRSVRN